ncbi:MAG: T9SS type A sorting domain-containing protein [Saprospiraceae bacterium]
MRILYIAIIALAVVQAGFANYWQVGPGKTYTAPSQVSSLVEDGDTVAIDAGVYESDVARWAANDLFITGVGGKAHLKANGNSYGQKAIWVIAGDNTRIENIEFSLCTVPDQNGAGIRQEGKNLTVRYCHFHHNDDGILAGTMNPSNIIIEFCEFGYNGYGDGQSHNLYINNIDTLIFRFNYSHHTSVGHELKSRAHVNYILYNRISDEAGTTSSRSIDLPNGGTTYLIGNLIEQGPESENSNIIGYGLEGLNNPSPHELFAINNTIINNRSNGSFFSFQNGTTFFKAFNNIIAGPGVFVQGNYPSNVDTASNIMSTDIGVFEFADPDSYDFHLTANSQLAIDQGSNPGSDGGFSLSPVLEYMHPSDSLIRCQTGFLDIGAYEFCIISDVQNNPVQDFKIYPNPAHDFLYVDMPFVAGSTFEIFNSMGQLLLSKFAENRVDISQFSAGIYFIIIKNGASQWCSKFVKE